MKTYVADPIGLPNNPPCGFALVDNDNLLINNELISSVAPGAEIVSNETVIRGIAFSLFFLAMRQSVGPPPTVLTAAEVHPETIRFGFTRIDLFPVCLQLLFSLFLNNSR
jgi:hypothetical protein